MSAREMWFVEYRMRDDEEWRFLEFTSREDDANNEVKKRLGLYPSRASRVVYYSEIAALRARLEQLERVEKAARKLITGNRDYYLDPVDVRDFIINFDELAAALKGTE
jgi:adenylate kinase family enzyme